MTLDDIEKFVAKNKKKKILMIICTIGTTLTCAVDDVNNIAQYCNQNNIYIHVDASYMGSMFLIDDFRQKYKCLNYIDSININLSKWMCVNLDAACLWVKKSTKIIESLDTSGPYLISDDTYTNIPNYRNWSLSFSRRFRSLKVWFVMKGIGINRLKNHITNQIAIADKIKLDLFNSVKNNIEFLSMQYDTGLLCFRILSSCLYTKYLAKILRSREYCLIIQTVEVDNKYYVRMCINSNYLSLYNYKKNISDKLIKCIKSIENFIKPTIFQF
jgi:glutamate/tyrosine decarboxylase-like PLP-dependent enzyme